MTEYIGIEIGRRGMKLAVVEAGKTQAVVTEKRSIAFEEPFSIEIIEKSLDLINRHVEEAKKVILGKFPSKVESLLKTWAEGNRNFSREPRL